MAEQGPALTVLGEALIDLVPVGGGALLPRPGGSPYNVAIGAARLGVATALMARLADNAFGRLLRGHAAAAGVDLTAAPCAAEPTTLAVVSIDESARLSYDFYVDGTADWQWTPLELGQLPSSTQVLHFGSLASWTPPGCDLLHDVVSSVHAAGSTLVSYDPNIRPLLLGEPAPARALVERSIAVSHLVKASQEDLDWLYPGQGRDDVADRWLGLGAAVVVVTDGPAGASAHRAATPVLRRPGRAAEVADTVGAGDAFTSALLASLLARGAATAGALPSVGDSTLGQVIDDAVLVSSLTCERVGADPPRLLADWPDRLTREDLTG